MSVRLTRVSGPLVVTRQRFSLRSREPALHEFGGGRWSCLRMGECKTFLYTSNDVQRLQDLRIDSHQLETELDVSDRVLAAQVDPMSALRPM
jgi:hypothetical protein